MRRVLKEYNAMFAHLLSSRAEQALNRIYLNDEAERSFHNRISKSCRVLRRGEKSLRRQIARASSSRFALDYEALSATQKDRALWINSFRKCKFNRSGKFMLIPA